jgi:hypothetical protein
MQILFYIVPIGDENDVSNVKFDVLTAVNKEHVTPCSFIYGYCQSILKIEQSGSAETLVPDLPNYAASHPRTYIYICFPKYLIVLEERDLAGLVTY